MNGDSYRLAQSRGRKGIAINQGQDRLALAGQSAQAPGRPPHSWCQIQAPSSGQHLLRHMAGFCSAVDMRAVPLYPVGVAPEAVGSGVTADKVRLDDVATIAA